MKYYLQLFVVCCGLSAMAEEKPLRVLAYNIRHAQGVDRVTDIKRIARVIVAQKPDLVALQEVDKNS